MQSKKISKKSLIKNIFYIIFQFLDLFFNDCFNFFFVKTTKLIFELFYINKKTQIKKIGCCLKIVPGFSQLLLALNSSNRNLNLMNTPIELSSLLKTINLLPK